MAGSEVPVRLTVAAQAPHEWVSFDDADGNTFLFDATFLMSNWVCIWDDGCHGILSHPAPELVQGCCSFGAHFTDDEDRESTMEAAVRLTAEQWQFHGTSAPWYSTDADGDQQTLVVDSACIFLNRPGFAGGPGCALHRGAVANNERPLDWKPNVCWQLPLRLDEHVDDNDKVVTTLRQWRRADWGDGGEDLHSFCTEHDQAFVERQPVYETLEDEIVELVGQDLYDLFCNHVRQQSNSHYLPHPVLRSPTPPPAANEYPDQPE